MIYTFIASEEDDAVDVYCNSSAKKARRGSRLERINELQCQVKELNEKLAAVDSSTHGMMENNISLTDLNNLGTALLPESSALSSTSKFFPYL